ncbi:MAG: L-2-amino-thiazoline-4-carboxylic acid hydrolase [Oscillospiraceae bacterium]|nr:L-2-amino-thiazoline-4-carboxylic acid hydrolase [Oscillospiraceae bacterium]
MSKQDIKEFTDSMHFGENITQEEFETAIMGAYTDRARQVWFIYKKIKELYPEVDAERIIREGSWDFGVWQGEQIVKRYGAENITPREALFGQTSKGGMLVFSQEILEADENKAVKLFNRCPHVNALRELGATPEEIKCFCRNMIGACDYGIVHPFPNVEIDFPTTVADGEGEPCRMTITRK